MVHLTASLRRSAAGRDRGDEAAPPRRRGSRAGRSRHAVRPRDARRIGRDVAAGRVPHRRRRRTRRRHDGRAGQRRLRAGARVRRHAQRVHRPHEQPGRGRGARAVGDDAGERPRSGGGHRGGQRNLVPDRQRRAGTVPPARLSSRRGSSRRSASRTWPAACWASMPDAWRRPPASAAASRRAFSSAGSTARTRSSCTPDGPRRAASPRHISRART